MFELVPGHVQEVDRPRFSRILTQLDEDGKKHDYKLVDTTTPSSVPLFTAVDASSCWVLTGERKLQSDERPHAAFDIAAVDMTGTWLLDRAGSSAGRSEVKSVRRRMDRRGLLLARRARRRVPVTTASHTRGDDGPQYDEGKRGSSSCAPSKTSCLFPHAFSRLAHYLALRVVPNPKFLPDFFGRQRT